MEGVLEQLDEDWCGEELLAVAELEIYVAGALGGIGPDDGMVAHLDVCVDGVAAFIDMCQNMYVGAWVLFVGIPLVIGDDEGSGKVFHHGVSAVFHLHCAVALLGDVVLVANIAHEVRKPLP